MKKNWWGKNREAFMGFSVWATLFLLPAIFIMLGIREQELIVKCFYCFAGVAILALAVYLLIKVIKHRETDGQT